MEYLTETGEDRVRLYGLETGSRRTGLFRRTLELSFLPRAAVSGHLRITDLQHGLRYI